MSEIKAWAVVDKGGIVDELFECRDDAERAAADYDRKFENYAPHDVIELTGTLPRRPEVIETWVVKEREAIAFTDFRSKADAEAFMASSCGAKARLFRRVDTEVLE